MVKFKQGDFNNAVKDKFSKLDGILFYGPDRGQILENFNIASDAIAPDKSDGFSVFEFTPEEIKADNSKLYDEATTISFLSTRKVIRIKNATNDTGNILKDLFKNYDKLEAFIIVCADELVPSSSLRTLFENNPKLAVLPSYIDEAENLSNIITKTLRSNGIKKIPDDVLLFLRENFGENRETTKMELEKLCLYLYGKDSITIEDAMNCVIDSSALNLSDLAMVVAEGNSKKLAFILPRLLNEGNYPVQLLRVVLNHFKSLYFMIGEIENGKSPSFVIDNAQPKIFYKLKPSYERQLKLWNSNKIIKTISKLNETEIMCKSKDSPQEIILSQALTSVCSYANKKI